MHHDHEHADEHDDTAWIAKMAELYTTIREHPGPTALPPVTHLTDEDRAALGMALAYLTAQAHESGHHGLDPNSLAVVITQTQLDDEHALSGLMSPVGLSYLHVVHLLLSTLDVCTTEPDDTTGDTMPAAAAELLRPAIAAALPLVEAAIETQKDNA